MNRSEFELLRNLPDKTISADIEFVEKNECLPNLTFEGVVLENSLDLNIVLYGTYKPQIPSVTFNFVQKGVGSICRLDVNGTCHREIGRTHKHELREESDTKPSRNLPFAVARPDLENKKTREIWEILCRQANIHHTGRFISPDEGTYKNVEL